MLGHGRRGGRAGAARAVAGGLLVLGGVLLTVGVAPAGADIVLPSPIGPITVPGPGDPPPTTTPPPTDPPPTTQPAPTTTTAPATTSTTAPGATTTTTRASRRSTTTTAGARGTGRSPSTGQAAGPAPRGATGGSRAANATSVLGARVSRGGATRGIVSTPSASGERIAPVTARAGRATGSPDRLRDSFLRATDGAARRSRSFDGSALAGILLAGVTAVVLGLAQRDAAHQRRSQATLAGSGALRLGRDESEAGVREQLRTMLTHGAFVATGSDCRSLQLLVQAAAHEGLEVRDPRGFIVAATHRLVQAYGIAPDHKRLPLRWAVEVGHPTMAVPAGYGYVLARTGPTDDGRLLAFTPGTEMRLWTGDLI